MNFDPDAARVRARELRAQADVLLDEAVQLEDRCVPPSIVIVIEVWRHHSRHLDELEIGATLRDATGALWGALDSGTGSPGGAYVGGSFMSYDELKATFGDPDEPGWYDRTA